MLTLYYLLISLHSLSLSLFNAKEADAVIEFIKTLLKNDGISRVPLKQSDIGVVTPYKLQCKVIGRACRQNGFDDVTIGTAEVFQGQERPVMIVSTVRTGGKLGFVKDPRVRYPLPLNPLKKCLATC